MKSPPPVQLAIAIIASLVFVAVIGFVDMGWPEFEIAQQAPQHDLPDDNARPSANAADEEDPCQRDAARFHAELEQSRACTVDRDCTIDNFGCQLGCTTAISRDRMDELRAARDAFQADCHLCLERCPDPVFEWRAACVRQRCILLDPSIEDLEEETLQRIEDAS